MARKSIRKGIDLQQPAGTKSQEIHSFIIICNINYFPAPAKGPSQNILPDSMGIAPLGDVHALSADGNHILSKRAWHMQCNVGYTDPCSKGRSLTRTQKDAWFVRTGILDEKMETNAHSVKAPGSCSIHCSGANVLHSVGEYILLVGQLRPHERIWRERPIPELLVDFIRDRADLVEAKFLVCQTAHARRLDDGL